MTYQGVILRAGKKEFCCKVDSLEEEIRANAPRKIFKNNQLVAGDLVTLEKNENSELYTIIKVKERSSEIFRMSIRERKKRVTAANCDLMLVTTSLNSPPFKQGVLDRLLIRATQWNIPAAVIFNKMDLFDSSIDLDFEIERLKSIGVDSYTVSALDPMAKQIGKGKTFDDLLKLLSGKLAILLGQSGVGKSKIISALSGGKIDLLSNKIGKSGKGSHTTTWSELIQCGSFNIIDSPGVRSLSLDDIDKDELMGLFPDLEQISLKCKFNNCTHSEKNKGCAFWNSKEQSALESKIIHSRLESYLGLTEELEKNNPW